jgi:hypothetical protein
MYNWKEEIQCVRLWKKKKTDWPLASINFFQKVFRKSSSYLTKHTTVKYNIHRLLPLIAAIINTNWFVFFKLIKTICYEKHTRYIKLNIYI